MTSPWISVLEPLRDPLLIKKRTEFMPEPLLGLKNLPLQEALPKLETTFEDVFIPTEQCTSILLQCVGSALAHARRRYPNTRAFKDVLYPPQTPAGSQGTKSSIPDVPVPKPIELMGLAGVGKSAIRKALMRLVPVHSHNPVVGHEFPLEPFWTLSVKDIAGISGLYANLLARGRANGTAIKTRFLATRTHRDAYLSGVGLLTIDELQLYTQSDSANTSIVKLLYRLEPLGVPLLFIENYSLAHLLRRRPQHDTDRFCANPIVMVPDPPGSKCFQNTLAAYIDVAPEILSLDALDDADEVHRLTFGLPRVIGRLLLVAYTLARKTSGAAGKVTIDTLTQAYASPGFSGHRRDVEILWRQAVEQREVRKDLWCPLEGGNIVAPASRMRAAKERERAFAQNLFSSSLTKDEKQQQSPRASPERGRKVVPLRTKTSEDLLRNANAFRDQTRSPK